MMFEEVQIDEACDIILKQILFMSSYNTSSQTREATFEGV